MGDSTPHQLQTNGLNLIRLFNPMALKFDTSSNYKMKISPPKIFQTLRLLVSPPLEQKSKFSLSRSHRLKLSLFTAQPLARISGSKDAGLFLIGKSLPVQSPNFKIFLSSTKPCCTWDTSVDSPWPWLQLEASKAHTTTTGSACWPDLLLSLGLCFFALSSPTVPSFCLHRDTTISGDASHHIYHHWFKYNNNLFSSFGFGSNSMFFIILMLILEIHKRCLWKCLIETLK